MLHEVLLALSGHPSALFNDIDAPQQSGKDGQDDLLPLSPSEKALLASIGQLSELHRKLRQEINRIAVEHQSTICRAVATSVQQVHLARFQRKIIDVESKILKRDASVVGAYDIVPLAGVVGEFEEWHPLMAWYWRLVCFMQSTAAAPSSAPRACTGAALIDKLRSEQQTGFPDIEKAAIELSQVAETAWLRQLSSWVLHGKMPSFGSSDFFVQLKEHDGEERFVKEKDLLPKFVTTHTASSILFIGKSLLQVREYGRQAASSAAAVSNQSISEKDLVSTHLQHLSALTLPIVSAQLSRAITAIRLSLSQNVLQHLLPMELTLMLLSCIKQFFLLERGEFALALISEADGRLQNRQQSMGRLLQQDPVKALQGLSIKDAEFQQTLSQTWKVLASRDEDVEDELLDFAEKHISLSTPATPTSRPPTSDSVSGAQPILTTTLFNDLLFPSAVSLGMNIAPPLDLFISPREIETYSSINAYLLALRRAQVRLTDLWRKTSARRDKPSSENTTGNGLAPNNGERMRQRRVATRKVWASCSAAIFLLSETSAYFEGEIIRESWEHFLQWVTQRANNNEMSRAFNKHAEDADAQLGTTPQRDPETLASGHRVFLASLTYALLLTDLPYTRDLRSLLGNVDSLIAFFHRSLEIQQSLDVERDAGGETGYTIEESHRIALELDRARKRVDSDLKAVVNRLRQLDQERIGSGRYLEINPSAESGGFEPWKGGGGVDRLLMKLEFGGGMADGVI